MPEVQKLQREPFLHATAVIYFGFNVKKSIIIVIVIMCKITSENCQTTLLP